MFNISFEKCLIACIEEIIKDPNLLFQEPFRNVLLRSAEDWCSFCIQFNGGNETEYNLNRVGRRIDSIFSCCESPINKFNNNIRLIDWNRVLGDVKWISEVVQFEIRNNVFKTTPLDGKYKKKSSSDTN